jgi:hypothetical protein
MSVGRIQQEIAEIADTVQRWGHEDDITFLSVTRTVDLNPALA